MGGAQRRQAVSWRHILPLLSSAFCTCCVVLLSRVVVVEAFLHHAPLTRTPPSPRLTSHPSTRITFHPQESFGHSAASVASACIRSRCMRCEARMCSSSNSSSSNNNNSKREPGRHHHRRQPAEEAWITWIKRSRGLDMALPSQATSTLEQTLVSSSSAGKVVPLDEQPYKVVTAWQYNEGDDSPSFSSAIHASWEGLADLLFEMGAVAVSVEYYHTGGDSDDMGRPPNVACWHRGPVEGEPRRAVFDDRDNSSSDGDVAAGEKGDTAVKGMLRFTVEGRRDVGATLKQACELLAGSPADADCFDNLDWDEGPVECCNSWEAAAASEGFNTLCLRRLQVMPVQRDEETPAGFHQMKLLEGQGWGDGEHPSTWLCLDFLEMMIRGGEEIEVIDYGTGSGVLATAAALLGARRVTGVDLDVEILEHARQNFLLNGVGDKVSAVHTRDVSIGDLCGEVVVVNMLAGPMLRLMPVLVLAVKAGGSLCLSGLRPSDVPVIKRVGATPVRLNQVGSVGVAPTKRPLTRLPVMLRKYGKYMDWNDAFEACRFHDTWGEWMRIVGRPKPSVAVGGELRMQLDREFSEIAVC